MRNKRETDISNYTDKTPEAQVTEQKTESGVKRFFKAFGKFMLTAFAVCFIAGVITSVSLGIYIFHLASEPTGIDLKAKSLNQTSRIFVKDAKTGEFTERQKLYDVENRTWVDFAEIPQYMKDAQVTIEDKRFYQNPLRCGRARQRRRLLRRLHHHPAAHQEHHGRQRGVHHP